MAKNYAPLDSDAPSVIFAPCGIPLDDTADIVSPEVPRWPGDKGARLQAPEPFPTPPNDRASNLEGDEGD